jgi:hypothetical protein
MAGKTSEARQKLDALKQSNPPVTSWAMAFLHAGLGDRDQAFEWLEKARDEHFNVFATVNVDPAFDSLRSNPRFAPLMRSIRLRQ